MPDVISEKMSIPQYMFRLSGLGDDRTDYVEGTMLNPLNLAGSNTFTTSGEMVRDAPLLSTAVTQVIGAKVEDFTTKHGQRQLGGYGKFSKGESRAKWTDSSKPQIVCVFRLLANSADDAEDNADMIQLIKSAVLPIDKNGLLLAPLGYKGGKTGTLTFSLGSWFLAPKLIMMAENCEPSVQIMRNGYPLEWNCSITLEPYETTTIADFKRWFQAPTVISSGASTGVAGNVGSQVSALNQIRGKLGI